MGEVGRPVRRLLTSEARDGGGPKQDGSNEGDKKWPN